MISLICGILKKKKNRDTKPEFTGKQTGGCQSWKVKGQVRKGGRKTQISTYKISHEYVMYSLVTTVDNTILHI